MVKDNSDGKRENRLPPLHGLLFTITATDLSYAPSHIQDSTYHGLRLPNVEHWLEREIAQWVHHHGLIRGPIAP